MAGIVWIVAAQLAATAPLSPTEAERAPEAPHDDRLAVLGGGAVGAAVGAVVVGGALGGATLAIGYAVSWSDCRGGCTDSNGTAFLVAAPAAAAVGVVVGALAGAAAGAFFASDEAVEVIENTRPACGSVCPAAQWCL